jgi:transposase
MWKLRPFNPDRFWERVDQSGGADACWPWTGCRMPRGYGKLYVSRVGTSYAHRVAFELTNGPISAGMVVCHHCDNPPCCNPRHLFVGTHKDNSQDASRKKRWPSRLGMYAGGRKVTDELISEIAASHTSGESMRSIAKRLGISRMAVRGELERLGKYSNEGGQLLGEQKPESKLTADQVREMRALHEAGTYNTKGLARKFNVAPSTVYRVLHRVNWRHI